MELITVAHVSFRRAGKLFPFTADGLQLLLEDYIVVETSKGLQFGSVKKLGVTTQVEADGKIVRLATDKDIKQNEKNEKKSIMAREYCQDRIRFRKLPMKLLEVVYGFAGNYAIFYFSANGRIDFREIVKDLASRLRIRVEMKQVGVRDELKILGAIGICGRETCCASFLRGFSPISIKMAKNQNLPLNPAKVSGICGRLLCCLEYENKTYVQMKKGLPSVGKRIKLPQFPEKVRVAGMDLFSEICRIELSKGEFVELPFDEVRNNYTT